MKSLNTMLLLLLTLIHTGCGPTDITITKKPSYADLVVTYNAEVETLDRLEEKRTAAIAEYFSQAQGKAIESAVQSIKSGSTKSIPTDPNQALDQAVAAAELQTQLLGSLGQPSDSADYPEELKAKLKDLDSEIASQKERVDRAKAARDAAQTK